MVQFQDYDKIVDILMYLSKDITLNYNVILSKKSVSNERMFFHYETEYNSKYYGVDKGHTIKRNMTYFFTLDDKTNFLNSFIIRPQDVVLLLMGIENKVLSWFIGKTRIYSLIDQKLVITGKYSSFDYVQNENKYISIHPIVITYEDGTFKEGVRLYLNTDAMYADIDLDKFMGLYYTLKNTDMYSVACSMVTYVKTPPYEVNTFRLAGLGGGMVQDKWNEEVPTNNATNDNKFLNSIKKK